MSWSLVFILVDIQIHQRPERQHRSWEYVKIECTCTFLDLFAMQSQNNTILCCSAEVVLIFSISCLDHVYERSTSAAAVRDDFYADWSISMISFMTAGSMPSVFFNSLPSLYTIAEGALEMPKYFCV